MMMLVDDSDAGVGDLHTSDLRRLTLGREHRRGWSNPRPVGQLGRDPVGNLFPQAKSGIVTLSPVVQRTDVAERHDSGRSAVVSLLGDRSPAVFNHLEHRWVVPDLLGALVGLLVPAGNHTHYTVVISGQPSLRGRSTTELFVRTGVPPFVRVARRGRNPVHEFVDRSLAAGLLDLTQRRRTHEIRLLGGCLSRWTNWREVHSRPSGCRRSESASSHRHPRAIPARHRRTGDDSGCQRRPRNMAQPGDLPELADQRLFQNSALRRLGVKRARVPRPCPNCPRPTERVVPNRLRCSRSVIHGCGSPNAHSGHGRSAGRSAWR